MSGESLVIVLFVIIVGAFYVNPENWHPFAPFGYTGLSFFGKTLFGQTGYRVEAEDATILPSLQKIYAGYHGGGAKRIELGRLTLTDISAEELRELCAEELLLRVRA